MISRSINGFLGTQPALSLTWHRGLSDTKAQLSSFKRHTKPKIFPVWPFTGKVCRALSYRLTKEREK